MGTIRKNHIAGLLLSISLCTLAGVFFAGQREAPELPPSPPEAQSSDSEASYTDGQLESRTQIVSASRTETPAVAATELPSPNFQLIGTLIAPPLKRAAIIAMADEEIVLTQGASIDGHWALHQVLPGKIVIRSAKRDLILGIRAQATTMGRLQSAPIEADPRNSGASHAVKLNCYYANRAPEAVAFPEGLSTHGIEKVSEQTFSVDVNALLDQFLLTPPQRQFDFDMDDGGMRFVEIVPGGVVDRFGFVPGDTITKINATRITAIEDLQCLLQSQKRRVEVEFRRADASVVHTYLLH